MIQYAYTILYVAQVAETIVFYENAFGFERKFITPEADYGEINTGTTTIAFASLELAHSNLKAGFVQSKLQQKAFGIELGFTTEQPAAVIAQAKKFGAIEVEPLRTKPWGQQVAYLRDCNGFLIEICTPMPAA